MSLKESVRDGIGWSCETVLGRRNLYRLARMLAYRARRDTIGNQISRNGESDNQDSVIKDLESGTIFDIGANIGEWSASVLRRCAKPGIRLHAFEPCAATYAQLRANVNDPRFLPVQFACSDHSGTATINIVGIGTGRNSLVGGLEGQAGSEIVNLTTVDEYCSRNRIASVDLIKIDAEGHDLAVMNGARGMLAAKAISALQFEYNHRWIFSRSFLKDAFELFGSFGYSVGKVTAGGVEFYSNWNSQLENFVENNFVACLPRIRGAFHQIEPQWL
jgi:FkbM family methyltransferase